MAEVNTDQGNSGGKHNKRRAKKASTKIDMTPMVDLAFLLLTFFVLTSTFNKPKAMELAFPKEDVDSTKNIKVNNALTILLGGEDNIYYYYGEFYPENNVKKATPTVLNKTNYAIDGLHELLLEKNKSTVDEIDIVKERFQAREISDSTYKELVTMAKKKKGALTVLVKANERATYKNVIDVIDELNICNIGKYAVVEPMKQELALMAGMQKTNE